MGLNPIWAKLLKRLDRYRPIVRKHEWAHPVVDSWHSLDSADRAQTKNRFQTFQLYYVPGRSVLNMSLSEHFECMEKIRVKWIIKENDSIIDEGFIDNLPTNQESIELIVPTKKNIESANYAYYFQVVIKEDCFPFTKNDIIALSKFRYSPERGKLVYKVDY